MAALFQGVADEHRRNCKQAEDRGSIHNLSSYQLARISGAIIITSWVIARATIVKPC